MTSRAMFATALVGILISTVAAAGDRGTRDEAIALWNKGKAYFDQHGGPATMAAVTDKNGGFVDRDLYIFCYDANGITTGNGANAKLIGVDATQLRDADGKAFALDILKIAHSESTGWVDFKWVDPVTKKIMPKSSYVGAYGDYTCGVGVYQ